MKYYRVDPQSGPGPGRRHFASLTQQDPETR
jgi:hypothetical protein